MSQDERIRVAIVGAGIAGLTLAVALNALDKDHKITIDLYEAAPELSEIGAGLNVWYRTWQVFRNIGLGDALIPLFDHYPDLKPRVVFEVRKADQKNGFKIVDIMKDGGALRIHRADLQRTLIKHLPLPGSNVIINSPCTLHLSHRLTNYTPISTASISPHSGPVTLHFSDKPPTTCDILIGADGLKSTVRQLFLTRLPDPEKYKPYLEPVWSGTIAYRGLVTKEELREKFPGHRALDLPGVMYIGKHKHTVVYPIGGGKLINVVATIHDKSKDGTTLDGPWNSEATQSEFYDQFVGWEEEFQALINCIKRPTKWALQSLKHLDVFAKGAVFLMGDSAHAMVPHQGAGAGIGIEDAYIFATLLTHPSSPRRFSPQHISHLAHIYNTVRVPRAIAMSKASIKQGYLYILGTPGFEGVREGEDVPKDMLVKIFREVEGNWSWTTSDPEEDRRKAVELLETGMVRL
ncbi:4-aminobenzoate hydroxylase [Macrolepiota fuliginosa MF-IS2]|uniref:4-aminobenzoate hydroxylase n=1 Tax=Macrolepiota fuliginosa MF-IS2 TaxID=1400762 RepID=A0A9P5XD26_9AGAR|nr:4-aminobenzoate hydroxylase [Macrolepiota fuliginosa MF-IS2]